MQTNHIAHSTTGAWCTRCHERFEIPTRVLCDAHKLLEAKEVIAARHACRKPRIIEIDRARVFRPVPLESDRDRYWTTAIAAAQRVN